LPSLSGFEPRIRAWGKLRLGDPSKNRYSVWEGFAGSANFAASAFRPQANVNDFDRWKGVGSSGTGSGEVACKKAFQT
jgi:hypothetical protein